MSSDGEETPSAGNASLPKSTLQKMIRDSLPAGQRVAAELVDSLYECCSEYVEMVASSANDNSTQEKKGTINPEHVITALEQLGFTELRNQVADYWQQWKQDSKAAQKPRKKTGAEQAGMSEEEQIALQQKMFAEARAHAANNLL